MMGAQVLRTRLARLGLTDVERDIAYEYLTDPCRKAEVETATALGGWPAFRAMVSVALSCVYQERAEEAVALEEGCTSL